MHIQRREPSAVGGTLVASLLSRATVAPVARIAANRDPRAFDDPNDGWERHARRANARDVKATAVSRSTEDPELGLRNGSKLAVRGQDFPLLLRQS